MSKSSERRLLAAAAGLGLLAIAALVVRAAQGSEPIDPTVAQTWVVGTPRGAAPMARLDRERSGRASTLLPTSPRIHWRARVQGGIAHPVAVDARGNVIVASPIATLTELSADGKTAWSARTGATPAAVAPVLTSDGTRVVLTASGELLGFDARGKKRFAVSLAVVALPRAAEPLPLDDGGLVLAAGRTLLHLDRKGSVRATTKLEADVAQLLRRGSETLVLTDRGDVHSWRPPAETTEIGSFGGKIDGAALFGDLLTAVVDQKKLTDLNLKTGTRLTRVEVAIGLAGPPALAANGSSRVVTLDGLLLGHDKLGGETLRVALEPPTMIGDAGALSTANLAPPVFVDPRGRVGFVRPGLDAGVVDNAGGLRAAAGAACLDPIGVAPAGPAKMVLACRSGVVFLIGDK